MEITLSQRDIDAIVHKLRVALRHDLAKMVRDEQPPDLVTTREAAAILRVTPDHLRHVAHKYPHTKAGEGRTARLLFDRKALIR